MSVRRPLDQSRLKQLIAEIEPLKRGFDLLAYHTVITDPDANVLYANRAAQIHTGYNQAEIIGSNPGDLWGGHMPQRFYESMWHTIKDEKKPFLGEVKNVRKDGTEYWQEIIISPVLSKEGVVRFFIAFEPIIENRHQREKFQQEFITILSHQLQSPLTAIKWSLELLQEQGGLSSEQLKILETIYQKDKSLIDLVADLVIMSRIGRIALKPEMLDLAGELQSQIQMLKNSYQGINFTQVNLPNTQFMVDSKSLALQVFHNLISNAFKYCRSQVNVAMEDTPTEFVFNVSNDGDVIPALEQKQIFQQLFRGGNSGDRPGTGVGLYIVKLICDSFCWRVTFQSPDSSGQTVFSVSIPKKNGRLN